MKGVRLDGGKWSGRFQGNKEEKVSIFITLQAFEEPLDF